MFRFHPDLQYMMPAHFGIPFTARSSPLDGKGMVSTRRGEAEEQLAMTNKAKLTPKEEKLKKLAEKGKYDFDRRPAPRRAPAPSRGAN